MVQMKCLYHFLCVFLLVASAFGAVDSNKVVRVGWFEGPYNLKDAYDRRSGYGYEYQQKIAAYTGWTYDYVEDSWPNLLEMLEKGEIDLLSDVSYTVERSDKMLFSAQSMGEEDYYAFVRADSKFVTPDNIFSSRGTVFGVNKGSVQKKIVESWAKKNHLEYKLVESTDTESENAQKLNDGVYDVFVGLESLGRLYNVLPVKKVGYSKCYFVVNKDRPDLLNSLDSAMDLINEENHNYQQSLYELYFNNASSLAFLNDLERDWLGRHGVIRVGYRDDFMPYAGTDSLTGKVKGVLGEFLKVMERRFYGADIRFEAVPYKALGDAISDLQQGRLECVFPVNMSVFESERRNLLRSNKILNVEMFAAIRKGDADKFSLNDSMKVSFTEGNISYGEFLKDHFPHWKVMKYAGVEECIRAVRIGGTDVFLINSHRLNRYNRILQDFNLQAIATGMNMDLAFLMNREDMPLFSMINKARGMITDAAVESFVVSNSLEHNTVTLGEFIQDHFFVAMGIMFVIILVVVVFLLKSMKMEKAAVAAQKAKSMFLSRMSHDIRTPMNIIVGLTDIGKKNGNDAAKMKDCLEKISVESVHLQKLINDILDISAIEAGKMQVKPAVENLNTILDSLNISIKTLLADKPMDYSFEQGQILSPYIKVDGLRLAQIYGNLLSNAVKYTQIDGRVQFFIWQEKRSDGRLDLKARVSDTGIGMSEELMKNMYSDFSRGVDTRVNKIQGTGLGLAIVKQLVEQMKGKITVESRLNAGTTFLVSIPVEPVEHEEEQVEFEETLDVNAVNGMRVLIAEDNELNYEIACELLSEFGLNIVRAEDGVAAVERFSRSPEGYYDFILMDMQMPKMDGLDATREIRKMLRPDAKSIPIVAMTANAFVEDAQACLDAGMDGHLPKPMNVMAVLETIIRLKKNR
ncbi:amino acid-binding domain sensor hybrid histidine kinase [Fibrobacter sp. UWEL]|nr:amino acid-binding domain sensor hybrid histidine kinase [Fibrobacter sp. UWEL]